jgi:flagellar basal-body rod protein FlgB
MSMVDTLLTQVLARSLDVNAFRHQLITSNMANLDTPGYHTRDIDFQRELERAGSNLSEVNFPPAVRPVLGLMERPDGNNVSMEREGLLLAETQLRFSVSVELLRSEFRRLSMAINEGR